MMSKICGNCGITMLTLMFFLGLVDGHVICPLGEFQPEHGEDCKPCSSCYDNKEVKVTCREHRDTVCGPFTAVHIAWDSHGGNYTIRNVTEEVKGVSPETSNNNLNDNNNSGKVIMVIVLGVVVIIGTIVAIVAIRRFRNKRNRHPDTANGQGPDKDLEMANHKTDSNGQPGAGTPCLTEETEIS